jgi:hypothetical protein
MRTVTFLLAFTFASYAHAQTSDPPNTAPARLCAISAEDQAWIARSVAAWRFATRAIGGFEAPAEMQSVFFDDDCTWISHNALGGAGAPDWNVASHAGMITLPNRKELPAGVISFASGDEGHSFFVMSTPSVWRAGGVDGGPLGLDTLMTAVLLHEASHVTQVPTYGKRIGRLAEANGLPEDFNDDSLQRRFENDADFSASIARETKLFLAAASAADDGEARRLAREARDMMRARAARYFVGTDAYYAEAEDIWLTFEGSAQWLAYHWVTSPQGANAPTSAALPGFAQRSRWWSQKEGFALFMVLDRLTRGSWRTTVFGDGSRTAFELIDQAIEG